MNRVSLLACSLLVSACPAALVPDPLPEAPHISEFTVSPSNVARGGTVTLKWRTENAPTVEVLDLSRGAISGAADKAQGEVQVVVAETTVFVLSAKNSRGVRATAVVSVNVDGVNAPAIVFTAYPPLAKPGQPSLLIWNAPNAQKVGIAPQGGTALDLKNQKESGSIEVDPSAPLTTYVLTADGVERTAQVIRSQAITEFKSSSNQVKGGDSLTLSWKTLNASKVRLSTPGRGTLVETTDATQMAAGTFSDAVANQIDGSILNYVLEVEGRGPVEVQRVRVTYGTAPTIVSVTAPQYVKENLSFELSWTTTGADRVEVRAGQQIVYRTPNPDLAPSASATLLAPAAETDYVVAAISTPTGAEQTKTVRVTPVTDLGALTLTAAPTTVATGGTPVTLTWNAPGAVRVRIVEDSKVTVVAAEGPTASTGTATVYPNSSTTRYELQATNTLEPVARASAQVTVTTPASLRVADAGTVYLTQNSTQLTWTVGGSSSELLGFGTPAASTGTSTGFLDISQSGKRLNFADGNEGVTSFTPVSFETFLGNRRAEGPVWVSTNGFIVIKPLTTPTALPTPRRFPNTTLAEDFIAPFWTDLDVTTGAVYWEVVGTAPNRELVVQWDRATLPGQLGTSATFELRLHQSGRVAFEYRALSTPTLPVVIGYQGPNTIGYTHVMTTTAADAGTVGVLPSAGSNVVFGGTSRSPAIVSTLAAPGGGSITIGAGALRIDFDEIVKPTDIYVSEVMSRPNPAVPQGQWFEIANFSNATIDLAGWTVSSSDAGIIGSLPATPIAPRSYAVVARTTDPDQNDGLPSTTIALPNLVLPTGIGDLQIANPQGFVNTLLYPAAALGVSLTVDPGPFVNRGALSTDPFGTGLCPARPSQTFGNLSPSQRGTPGATGAGACIGYVMQTITPNFKDIATTGLTLPISSLDDAISTLNIAANPVNLFGASATALSISTNGWLVPGTYSVSDAYTNKTAPDANDPDVGSVIAPFWDDLRFLSARTGSAVLTQRFNAGTDPNEPRPHWIIQWNRAEHYIANDEITFQVKVFDNGDLEYHYKTLVSATVDNYAAGTSATVWLEASGAAPTRALVYSVNKASLSTNVALRFTRVP